jgi:hypothetical protein
MIIAIDFDGTITTARDYGGKLKLRAGFDKFIKRLYKDGHRLILWTCRQNEALDKAKKFLSEKEILDCFETINDNLPDRIEFWGSSSRKIEADLYIDDRGLVGIPNITELEFLIRLKSAELGG